MTSFAADSSLTVGLEEELLLVDAETLQPAAVAGDVLAPCWRRRARYGRCVPRRARQAPS